MNGAFAIDVRGWSLCVSPEITARELLGPSAFRVSVDITSDDWRVEDPLTPEAPVGPVTSLVTFESDMQVEVMIVPGSQGQSAPSETLGHEVVTLTASDKTALVLDARCWYRLKPTPRMRINLWLRQPVAIQS
ncbi:MAG TPA: hypothetical protein VF088_08275 [Pyrinomonadaceae bacterium]